LHALDNLCSDEELQSLCFQRPGTLEYIRDEASAALGVLSDEMVEA